ncbi:MAG: protein kinase [Thermoanaerobaculales bacterium]|nr:protein kinase [Thermoanaerobaculales bacterium]
MAGFPRSAGAVGAELRTGVVLGGRFLVRELLGEGGSGTVYAALDTAIGQKVALKVLRPELADDPNRERLRREVRAARPGHPNIVTVFDLHEHDGLLFLSMELVAGRSLREYLNERGTLPVDEVTTIGARLAEALAHLHGRGLVHRDVKPGNVLLGTDGSVKLCDLGLARPLARGVTITDGAAMVGTPAYMAPEQATAAEPQAASDVYALGLSLYRCLSGSVPLERDTAIETLVLRQRARPPRLPRGTARAPGWLLRLLRRMLEPDPRDRPAAAVVAAALGRRALPWRPSRRESLRAAAVAGVVLLSLGSAAVVRSRLAGYDLDPSAGLVHRAEPYADGTALEILDDNGRLLHRVLLERPWEPTWFGPHARRAVAFGDLDGDGAEDAVVIRQSAAAEGPIEVLRRRRDGSLAPPVAVAATASFAYDGATFVGFQPVDVHCADLDLDGRDEIVLLENSSAFFPAVVRVLGAGLETRLRLWHPGQLISADTGDRDRDGRPELYLGGTSNFLTPPASNTSKPILMVVEADWRLGGQEVDLFAPGRRLSSALPAGVRVLYAVWERVVVASYADSWQSVAISGRPGGDPAHFLALAVSDANPVALGLASRKRLALRAVVLDRSLRLAYAQWEPRALELLGLDATAPDRQAQLRPQYWTGTGWSAEPVFISNPN